MKLLKNVTAPTQKLIRTVAAVVLVYILMEILIAAGCISSLIQGLLVPVCTYSIAAVALNLCV